MLNFHEENQKIFDFYIKVEKAKDSFNTKVLFPENTAIPEIAQRLELFCFPYQQLITDEEYKFYLCLTDSSKKQTYIYINRKKTVAYCLLSPFYHPNFFLNISCLISGVKEYSIPSACLKFLDSQIYHEKYDWRASWNAPSSNEFGISNHDLIGYQISPSCELSKLYQFIFNKLPIPYILITLVAMSLDCRIVVISSNLSDISEAVFSLISLIYPLKWPGTFIPILPSSILTMLDAPFAYLIGIHSSTADTLLSIDRYFLVNIDFHYCASVGMEDFPPEVLKYINEQSDKLKKIIYRYSPIFPFIQIQKQIRLFIRGLFGVAYSLDKTDDFQKISKEFNQWKSVPSEEFKAIFSQTQFTNCFINEINYEHNKDVFQAYWPNRVFLQFEPPPPAGSNKDIPSHTGWKRSRKNSIGKLDLEKLSLNDLHDSTEKLPTENNNSSNDEIKTDKSTNDENNKNNNNLDQIKNEEENKDTTESENLSENEPRESGSKRRKRKKVNSVQLSSLNLGQLKLSNSNLEGDFSEDISQPNSARRSRRKRSSKHRSHSVENRLLVKNNSYSVIHHQSRVSKEAPNLSMKKEYPEFFDKNSESYIKNATDNDFIAASDDQNLSPVPRKAPPPLPIPKRPLPNFSIKQEDESTCHKDGIRSARVHRHKVNSYASTNSSFNYNNQPKGGILVSSSFYSRNSSEEKNKKQNELSLVKKVKRSSSVSLQQTTNTTDTTSINNQDSQNQRRKRRTRSNLSDTDNHSHITFSPQLNKQKSDQILASHMRGQKENNIPVDTKKAIKASSFPEDNISISKANSFAPIDMRNGHRANPINKSATSYDEDSTSSEKSLLVSENSEDRTNSNSNIDNNNIPRKNVPPQNNDRNSPRRVIKSRPIVKNDEKAKTASEDEIDVSKKTVSPPIRPFKLRPLPSSDNKNKVSSLQLKSLNGSIRPYKQLTPRVPVHTNSDKFDDIIDQEKEVCQSGREISPTKKVLRNSFMLRPQPRIKIQISDDSDYDYDYYDDQPVKKTNQQVGSYSTRFNKNINQSVIKSNPNSSTRKRNTSLETPKATNAEKLSKNDIDEKTKTNTISPRNNITQIRRATPSLNKKMPSKPIQNQQKAPIIEFSSSSDYSE